MSRPNKQFVRVVLLGLMLSVGSVQAQVSYFCGMMDTVIHDECCCPDAGIDDMMAADSDEPCCEKSVELTIDVTSDQMQPHAKLIKFESDVDPPDTIIFAVANLPHITKRDPTSSIRRAPNSHTTGNATYLLTQRLRI